MSAVGGPAGCDSSLGDDKMTPDLVMRRRRVKNQWTKPRTIARPTVPPTMPPMTTLSWAVEEVDVLAAELVLAGGDSLLVVGAIVVLKLIVVEVGVGNAVDSVVEFALSLAAVSLNMPFVLTPK